MYVTGADNIRTGISAVRARNEFNYTCTRIRWEYKKKKKLYHRAIRYYTSLQRPLNSKCVLHSVR